MRCTILDEHLPTKRHGNWIIGDKCHKGLQLTRPTAPAGHMSIETVTTILPSYAWPLAVLVGLFMFRQPISGLIGRATKF